MNKLKIISALFDSPLYSVLWEFLVFFSVFWIAAAFLFIMRVASR